MSAPTQGPWFVSTVMIVSLVEEYEQPVAFLTSCDNAEANARLITTAPDLLELLKEVVLTTLPPTSDWDVRARAAIAKAEGR